MSRNASKTDIQSLLKRVEAIEKAVWTAAYVNDLPDSAFAYIEPGGKKDDEGKTVPRSLRHLPYKDKNGKPDPAHVRNALARLPQTHISASAKESARRKLLAAAKEVGIEVSEKKAMSEQEIENAPETPEIPEVVETPEAPEIMETPEVEPEPEPEPEPVVETSEPQRGDFDTPQEFHKAYTAWIEAEEAKAPVTKADLSKLIDEKIEELKAELLEEIPNVKIEDLTLGEAVKKSVPIRTPKGKTVDYDMWIKHFEQPKIPPGIAKEMI